MSKKYYELIKYEELKSYLDFFKNHGEYDSTFPDNDFNEAIKYLKETPKKTDMIESSLKIYLDNSDLLHSGDDISVIRALLKPSNIDKLRLIYDGSFYTHKIYFHVDKYYRNIIITPMIRSYSTDVDEQLKSMSKHMDTMTMKQKIQYLMDSFEVVYIQMKPVNNRDDIMKILCGII